MKPTAPFRLRGRSVSATICLVLIGAFALDSARGAIVNWVGGAGTGAWTTPANWSTNAAWVSTNTANFDTDLANNQYSITLGGPQTAAGITFGSGAATQGFTFNAGSTLTINAGGITNSDNDAQTFNNAIALGAAQSWNATSGALNFTGNIANSTFLLTLSGSGTANSISGIIGAGSGGVTVSGATWALSGVNTYTGATTITAGVLSIGTISNGGTASNLGAASTTAANLTLGGGTLQYTGTTASTNRNFVLTAGTTSTIDVATAATNLTISGASTNTTGGLTKIGAGTLTLSGANLYTGTTTVTDGTLAYGVANALSSGGVTVNGGTLALGTFSDTVGAVSLTGGSITSSTGVLTGTSYDMQNGSVSAILAGTGILTKSTAGTVTLSGTNTYTGATRINAGVLSIGTISNGGTASNLGAASTTAANLTLGGGTLQYTGATASTNRNFVLTTGTTSTIDVTTAATNLTISGASTATTGGLTKMGAGTLTLSGANLYTGATTINDGTLSLNNAAPNAIASAVVTVGDGTGAANSATLLLSQSNQIADTAAVTVNSDGVLNVNGKTETVGSIAGSGNILLGTGQLVAGDSTSTAYAGFLAGGATSILTKAGSGTLTINSNVNAVAGDFAGTLNLTAGGLVFNASNTFTGTVNVSAGTTLKLSDATLNIANLNFTGSGTVTLDFSGTASTLNVTNTLGIAAGITLNIINWQNAADFFFATNWTGAVVDLTGSAPMNQVVFDSPTYTGSDTKWQSYDNQITPVPEPSAYGALLLTVVGGFVVWRRFRPGKSPEAGAV